MKDEITLAFCEEQLEAIRSDRDEVREFLADACAFIRWAISEDKQAGWILAQVAHDLSGLANCEAGFSPRVSGYAERERKAAAALKLSGNLAWENRNESSLD